MLMNERYNLEILKLIFNKVLIRLKSKGIKWVKRSTKYTTT